MPLSIEQEATVRAFFRDSASFYELVGTWLSALERGEPPTTEQLALLRNACSVLRMQHEVVAALLQKLVH
jgi:hypothetical protein